MTSDWRAQFTDEHLLEDDHPRPQRQAASSASPAGRPTLTGSAAPVQGPDRDGRRGRGGRSQFHGGCRSGTRRGFRVSTGVGQATRDAATTSVSPRVAQDVPGDATSAASAAFQRPRVVRFASSRRAGRRTFDVAVHHRDDARVGPAPSANARARAVHSVRARSRNEVVGVIDDARRRRCLPSRRAPFEPPVVRSRRALARRSGTGRLAGPSGRAQAEMRVGVPRGDAAARGALAGPPAGSGGARARPQACRVPRRSPPQALDADRPAVELLDDRRQQPAVDRVEPDRIDLSRSSAAPATRSSTTPSRAPSGRSRARGAAGGWRCAACRARRCATAVAPASSSARRHAAERARSASARRAS